MKMPILMQLITMETLLFTLQHCIIIQISQRQVKGATTKFNVALQILLNAGASKTVINDDGETPFDVICFRIIPDCSESRQISLERLLPP